MKYNEIGKIAQTHGLKGEVKIKTDSDFVDKRYEVGATVYYKDKNNYIPLKVKSHRSMLNYELVMFEGLESIEAITPYLNKILYGIRDKNLLDEGEHYYSDLIGMKVYQNGIIKGTIKEIKEFPQYDYLSVLDQNNKEKLVPLLEEFILNIDEENGIIEIVDMEGLLWLDLIA